MNILRSISSVSLDLVAVNSTTPHFSVPQILQSPSRAALLISREAVSRQKAHRSAPLPTLSRNKLAKPMPGFPTRRTVASQRSLTSVFIVYKSTLYRCIDVETRLQQSQKRIHAPCAVPVERRISCVALWRDVRKEAETVWPRWVRQGGWLM